MGAVSGNGSNTYALLPCYHRGMVLVTCKPFFHTVAPCCRQQVELADVDLSRLSAQVEASAAAAADAQGLLTAAEARAQRHAEAARAAHIKVGGTRGGGARGQRGRVFTRRSLHGVDLIRRRFLQALLGMAKPLLRNQK